MAASERRVWTVGGLGHSDTGWTVTSARELPEGEFAELERKVAFVVELSSQSDYGRLVAAVRRFNALLTTAQEELEADGRLSPRVTAALPLDLVAVAEAARRLEATLAEKIDEATDLPEQSASAFRGVRHGIRASGAYLIAYEMARRAAEVRLVLRDGTVFFDGGSRSSADVIATTLLGLSFSIVAAYLIAFRGRFEEIAAELEQDAAAVMDGSPCLISYRIGASGPEQIQLKNIPLPEIKALRSFYAEGSAVQQPDELAQAALALAGANLRTDLYVGDVDIADGLVGGGATTGVNDLPTAKLELDLRLLGSTMLDYWGPLHYGHAQAGYERELFTGSVQSVVIQEDCVVLECEGLANLTEHASGGTLASGLTKTELMHSLLLLAGLPTDALALEPPPPEQVDEEFEVLLPIGGLKVSESVALGGMEIVPASYGEAALDGLERDGQIASRLRRAFADADSYGRALVTAPTLPAAQEAGVSTIESGVAWLVTRGRYGLARLPDGRAQPFTRQESLRAPQTGSMVLVRGTVTERCWLRPWQIEDGPVARPLESDSLLLDPPLPPDLPAVERHAVLALRRATSAAILETQLAALWEAIEFYAAGIKVEKLFDPAELKLLRESSPDWLSTSQRQRFVDVVGQLNSAPLSVRLALRLKQDGVPLTEHEHELLFKKLRSARNRPVHGKVPNAPTRAEIHHGISIVARMLVYRIARRGH